MTEHSTRYMVGRNWAEAVSDTTALPHRVLTIDEHGDATVRLQRPRWEAAPVILQISRAELALLAREARRAARRRFWARLAIR